MMFRYTLNETLSPVVLIPKCRRQYLAAVGPLCSSIQSLAAELSIPIHSPRDNSAVMDASLNILICQYISHSSFFSHHNVLGAASWWNEWSRWRSRWSPFIAAETPMAPRSRALNVNAQECDEVNMTITTRHHKPSPLRLSTLREIDTFDSLAAAVRNLETLLEFSCSIHKAPLIFPLLTGLIVCDFPRLIKR